jgi:predicted DNA-binding protein
VGEKMKVEKSLSIRIYPEKLKKLHYVADYEGRSASGQINYLIRKNIEEFERNMGEIILNNE